MAACGNRMKGLPALPDRPQRESDASHRGGPAGFVRVEGQQEWTGNYGDGRLYRNVTIAELVDGEATTVTDYWGEPVDTPEWRRAITDKLDMPTDGICKDDDHLARHWTVRRSNGAASQLPLASPSTRRDTPVVVQPREVAADVFWVRGALVNWYLLRDGQDLTLVDAGYPGDVADVVGSITALGHRSEDVRAIVITHAHADHLGATAALQAAHGTPAYIGAADLDAARTGVLEQVSLSAVLAQAWRPRVARWAVAAVRRGGRHVSAAPLTLPLATPTGTTLDLPGHPIAVPTPGHTPGHTAFYLPGPGAVLTGDALVTEHPTVRHHGPQTLPAMFDADHAWTRETLAILGQLDAGTILPGHGHPLDQSIREATERARTATGARRGARRR